MRGALPLLLIAAAAPLAGCGRAQDPSLNEQQAAAAAQRAPDPEKVMAERWAQMFANPAHVVAAANEFGYKASAYKAEGASFAARGTTTLPEQAGPVTVDAIFTATGAAADKIDTISFAFVTHSKGKPDRASAEVYRYPARLVNGFLSRFEVGPGDALNGAINRREAASVSLHGVLAKVDVKPAPAGSDAKDIPITVTFTRTGASAPANQTQGK